MTVKNQAKKNDLSKKKKKTRLLGDEKEGRGEK